MSTRITKNLLKAIYRAEKVIARERQRRLISIDLSVAQTNILTELHASSPMTLNELSQALATESPPSRVVSSLVDRKLVHRHDKPEDRRHVDLTLSKSGKAKIKEIRRIELAVSRWATKRLVRMPVKSAQKALDALTDGA